MFYAIEGDKHKWSNTVSYSLSKGTDTPDYNPLKNTGL